MKSDTRSLKLFCAPIARFKFLLMHSFCLCVHMFVRVNVFRMYVCWLYIVCVDLIRVFCVCAFCVCVRSCVCVRARVMCCRDDACPQELLRHIRGQEQSDLMTKCTDYNRMLNLTQPLPSQYPNQPCNDPSVTLLKLCTRSLDYVHSPTPWTRCQPFRLFLMLQLLTSC